MFENFIQAFPEQWQVLVRIGLLPISWIPIFQEHLLKFALFSDNKVWAILKWIFVLVPSIMIVIASWCTMVSIYTLPFRRNRSAYVATIFITWWDSLRACWLFWSGALRFVWLAFGWLLSLTKLIIGLVSETIRQVFYYPFLFIGNIGKQYFKAGIPWIAVIMTVLWILLEATIFTYVISPTVYNLFSNIVGQEFHRFLNPMLFLFLFLIIGGSFACLQYLVEAVQEKRVISIIKMLSVELVVAMVEVVFLYRDFVDALTPWIYQQTHVVMGLGWTLIIASCAWMGIRAMTWFFFARYGTSTLIAIIARKPIQGFEGGMKEIEVSFTWTKTLIQNFKSEINWFHHVGKELLESLTLPALQVIASAINFCMVFISSKPLFSLPFKHIEEVMETKELVKLYEQQKKSKHDED